MAKSISALTSIDAHRLRGFRAFVKHIYNNVKDWKGKIRLFYGARSGLELLYLNDKDGDLTNYYDEDTFEAFHALSPRPHWSDPIALDKAIEIVRAVQRRTAMPVTA